MLHTIGRNARTDDLVGLLLECHQRIRTFIGLAVAASERMDASADEVIDVCSRVERYFTDALPLHVLDEEESIVPRLRGRSIDLDAALGRMHDQHGLHVELIDRLLGASARVRATPSDPSARSALFEVASQLQAAFEPHLQAEEQIVFPAIGELPLEEQKAIIGELRARRMTPPTSRAPQKP
jgi:iron-sulfur cluster repair protein YtfE (RIC family)